MRWQDKGIIVSVRKHAESAAIISLLTEQRGIHAGIVRSFHKKPGRSFYHIGNHVSAEWSARLSDHLGCWSLEPIECFMAGVYHSRVAMQALQAFAELCLKCLPERDPHPFLYEESYHLLQHMQSPLWVGAYIRWELSLLRELGFGLDLSQCALTGSTENLYYVSPKTRRAATYDAGKQWHDHLLRLPAFLNNESPSSDTSPEEIIQGIRLTGFFLTSYFNEEKRAPLPESRFALQQLVMQHMESKALS